MTTLIQMGCRIATLGLLSGLVLQPTCDAQDAAEVETPAASMSCSEACAHPTQAGIDPATQLAALSSECAIIGDRGVPRASSAAHACATGVACEVAPADDLVPDPLRDQLVAHLRELEADAGDEELRLDTASIEAALGFRPSQSLLMEAISVVWPESEVQQGSSRCADYGACSLYGDLSNATGEQLTMYASEKALDGTEFDGLALPAFEARDLSGAKVSSKSLRGAPTLLVPIAVHCRHSYQTLPVLHDLAHRYKGRGLRVVGLLVNSGSPEDATLSLAGSLACHDFWVTDGDSVGQLLETRLVPSHLFINAAGEIERKFVGLKDSATLVAEIDRLLEGGEA